MRRHGMWLVPLGLALLVACSSDPARAPSVEDGGSSSSAGSVGNAGKSSSGGGRAGAARGDAGEAGSDGGAAGEGASPDAGAPSTGGMAGASVSAGPASCVDASETCGSKHESCCRSTALPGQTFFRSFDGVSAELKNNAYPASVSGFRLDQFEVTVARFRRFVTAARAGYRPAMGAGKHEHLNGGEGLVDVASAGTYEPGWRAAWNTQLDGSASDWDERLTSCDAPSWSSSSGSNELLPISCLSWYEAYAFCIWDGGFLPSEAEWNDAASAGSAQRVYPWSSPATSTDLGCSQANYQGAAGPDFCVAPGVGGLRPVGTTPAGNGAWGQADLAGNVFEWTLDAFAAYAPTCPDCFDDAGDERVIRGGGYTNTAELLLSGARNSSVPDARSKSLGARCARTP